MTPLSPQYIAEKLCSWRDASASPFSAFDPNTRSLCEAGFSRLCDATLLEEKLQSELGNATWRPLGRVLVVVSENDLLGTTMALVAACLTGNHIRVKARLTRALVEQLKTALKLDDEQCQILDWSSASQDDGLALQDVDGVLLAGGKDLILHYRRITPVGIRIIEYGPKVSCAAIGTDAIIETLVPTLLNEAGAFGQGVCSSPQFVLVENKSRGQELFFQVRKELASMSPLPYEEHLLQQSRFRELDLLHRLDDRVQCHLDSDSGWGMTLSSEFEPTRWMPKGIHIIAGSLASLLPLVAKRYRRQLQTLGHTGLPGELLASVQGFTRLCALGEMHKRGPLEPHDGMLELPQWVELLS